MEVEGRVLRERSKGKIPVFGILEREGKNRDSEGCDGGDITEGSNNEG